MPKVRDAMRTTFVSFSPSAPIVQVAQEMKTSGTGIVPLCENGKFRGLVTERDIVTGIVASAKDPTLEPAKSVMNNHYPLVSPGADIIEAASMMPNNGVRVLPVVQNGSLVGLLSLDDLSRESEALAAMVFCRMSKVQNLRQACGKRGLNDNNGRREGNTYAF